MEIIAWIGNHIEILIKSLITIILFFPFFKTWKACEDEIKSINNVLNNRCNVLMENIKRANQYYENNCNIDLSGITDIEILKNKIETYNLAIKEYQETFINTLNEQDNEISKKQEKLFDLRKNEWKSILPFLSVLALMWLGIKF